MPTIGAATIGTLSTTLFYAPAGAANISVTSDTSSTASIYLGHGGTVSTSNGIPIPPGATLAWASYPGSRGGKPVTAICAGSPATIGWLISSEG